MAGTPPGTAGDVAPYVVPVDVTSLIVKLGVNGNSGTAGSSVEPLIVDSPPVRVKTL